MFDIFTNIIIVGMIIIISVMILFTCGVCCLCLKVVSEDDRGIDDEEYYKYASKLCSDTRYETGDN